MTNLQHAGHRYEGDHDCFICGCDRLASDLERATTRMIVQDERIAGLEKGLLEALDGWAAAVDRDRGPVGPVDYRAGDEIGIADLRALLE